MKIKNISFLLISLWAIGGLNGQSFTVTEVQPMPMKVSNNAVTEAEVNGVSYVYSFAGIDSSKSHSGIGLWAFRYNTQTDSWDSVPPLPDNMGKIAASANRVKDRIYIIGGYHVFPNGSELSSDKVHIYDPVTNSYLPDGAPIPVPIDDQVQAVWRDSLIFVVTGWSQTRNVPNVQIYDPALDSWTMGSSVPNVSAYKSFGSSGAIVGDTLFYFGGAASIISQSFPVQNRLRMGIINPSDPSQITWTDTIIDTNLVGYRMASTVVNGNVHWIGGSNRTYNFDGLAYTNGAGIQPNNRNLYLDPHTLKWDYDTAIGVPFPMDLRGIGEVSANTRYIAGGMEANQKVSNKMLKLEFLKNSFSIEFNPLLEFEVFPNPNSGRISIEHKGGHGLDLILVDAFGRTIQEWNSVNSGQILDLGSLGKGIYFMKQKGNEQALKLMVH